jgi:hypothetical protein
MAPCGRRPTSAARHCRGRRKGTSEVPLHNGVPHACLDIPRSPDPFLRCARTHAAHLAHRNSPSDCSRPHVVLRAAGCANASDERSRCQLCCTTSVAGRRWPGFARSMLHSASPPALRMRLPRMSRRIQSRSSDAMSLDCMLRALARDHLNSSTCGRLRRNRSRRPRQRLSEPRDLVWHVVVVLTTINARLAHRSVSWIRRERNRMHVNHA